MSYYDDLIGPERTQEPRQTELVPAEQLPGFKLPSAAPVTTTLVASTAAAVGLMVICPPLAIPCGWIIGGCIGTTLGMLATEGRPR